jgi:hypothetical protein
MVTCYKSLKMAYKRLHVVRGKWYRLELARGITFSIPLTNRRKRYKDEAMFA